ncbi:MAG: hypothetical protein QOC82_253 [Frankiaceae bacterium]|nr:hypothetical protein [Frankiaceae bacterium]
MGLAAPATAGPYVERSRTVCHTRRRLLDDLRAQAAAHGAAGLGAITFGRRALPTDNSPTPIVELTATALPLFAAGYAEPQFRTTLAAAGIATLIRSGWMPADVIVADDAQLRAAADALADAGVVTGRSNAEIPGGTHMITAARSAVRAGLRRQAAALGADGLLVGPFESWWSATRHRVEVVAAGDAIVRWRRGGLDTQRPSPTIDLGVMGE